MTTLVLIRHANTFDKGDVIRRVGARSDLPLSSSGKIQAKKLGGLLRDQNLMPAHVFVSELKRTQETAVIALKTANHTCPVTRRAELNEIDYGPDEGKFESDVIARVGLSALADWDERGIMPPEWSPRPETITSHAQNLLQDIAALPDDPIIWVVTSNGIARFFTYQVAGWDCSRPDHLKLSTAAYAILQHDGKIWRMKSWNIKC
jgi:2,3-bisphosphoglycerate-dependent phosphoglycerate mutase